ncbi:MAG TPA: hypothetical protein EYP62_05760, partial [Kiritimatiellae bacterium]|nr:hypothetical protein [Kiritimatiellia bacterium]
MKARSVLAMVLLGVTLALLCGCAAVRASYRTVPLSREKHYDASFDATDMRAITDSVVSELLQSPLLSQSTEPPIMMVAGVENRTSQYVDTKNLTDRIRTQLIRSGQV